MRQYGIEQKICSVKAEGREMANAKTTSKFVAEQPDVDLFLDNPALFFDQARKEAAELLERDRERARRARGSRLGKHSKPATA